MQSDSVVRAKYGTLHTQDPKAGQYYFETNDAVDENSNSVDLSPVDNGFRSGGHGRGNL